MSSILLRWSGLFCAQHTDGYQLYNRNNVELEQFNGM